MIDSQPYAYAKTPGEMVSAYRDGKVLVEVPEEDSIKLQGYGLFHSVKDARDYLRYKRFFSGNPKAHLAWDLVFLPENTKPWRYIIPVLYLDQVHLMVKQPANCSEKL